MSRKIITLFTAIALICTCSLGVFAAEFDPAATGSVSVTLIEQNRQQPVAGAVLSVYHVATVSPDAAGNLIYTCTADFEALDAALDDELLAGKLAEFLEAHSVPSRTVTTDAQGTAVCDSLPLGLYFVQQTGAVEGFAPCTPFLVTVPNEKDGEYIYDVNASPKTEVEKLTAITIRKVWNADASTKIAESVTVQLLRDGTVVETAVLSQENDWQITYTDLPESDGYSIKEVHVPAGFTATYTRRGYEFTVTNTPSLAQTGQLVWPIPVLAVSGMLLLALGTALLLKKREPHA